MLDLQSLLYKINASLALIFFVVDSNSTPAERDKEAGTHGENTEVCELNMHP